MAENEEEEVIEVEGTLALIAVNQVTEKQNALSLKNPEKISEEGEEVISEEEVEEIEIKMEIKIEIMIKINLIINLAGETHLKLKSLIKMKFSNF